MYEMYAKSVELKVGILWGEIQVKACHEDLTLVGAGRSACVFRIKNTDTVIKIFHPRFQHIAQEEAEIYSELVRIPQFPSIYETGLNYIVMEYIQGDTLFDCLYKGIEIQEKQVEEVDRVLQIARNRGLNPSDVHLRNIIITDKQEVKIIDVARFKQTKNCEQWDDLKHAYFQLYMKRLFPRRLPKAVLNVIGKMYKKRMIPSCVRFQK